MGAVECQLEDESQQNITKLDVDSSLAMMKDMQASWPANVCIHFLSERPINNFPIFNWWSKNKLTLLIVPSLFSIDHQPAWVNLTGAFGFDCNPTGKQIYLS